MSEATEPLVKLGRLSHVGLVVKDVDETAGFFQRTFGIGPFSTAIYDFDENESFRYRGRPASARFKAALAFSGDVFVELIQVLEGETPHSEFLAKRGEGLQHVAFRVRDLEGALKRLAQAGIQPVLEYRLDTRSHDGERIRLHEAYLDTEGQPGGATFQLMEIRPLDA